MNVPRLLPAIFGAACAAISICGCASINDQDNRAGDHRTGRQGCDAASSEGTSASRSHARWLAEAGVRQQLPDVRGALLIAGFKRIHMQPVNVSCRPYALGGGLTQCSASRRLCGR